jgi:L-ascorbate metabolism protein UlaG (beta-lactamase superfamily)
MKIRMISNATCIYEHDGYRILSDPWLTEPIFHGSWYHDYPLITKPEDVLDMDALYISHIHSDHCDPETLKHFRKDIPIFVLEEKTHFLPKHLAKMGFTNVDTLEENIVYDYGPFGVLMFAPFTKHPYYECEIGNIVDSAVLFEVGGKTVLNCNDNMLSVEKALELKSRFGQIDVAQLNYNNAGPYPACFNNLTIEEKKREHELCIATNLYHLLKVARALGPRLVMPFAGAYKLGGGKEHLNEFLGTTTVDYTCEYLEGFDFKTLNLKENDEYEV